MTAAAAPNCRTTSGRFQFGLRWVFFGIAALLASFEHLATAFGLLLLTAAILFFAVWIIDSCVATRDTFRPHRPSDVVGRVDSPDELYVELQQAVELLRSQERAAQARYNNGAGPREDVFRAQGLRAIAEINLARHKAAKRRAMIDRFG